MKKCKCIDRNYVFKQDMVYEFNTSSVNHIVKIYHIKYYVQGDERFYGYSSWSFNKHFEIIEEEVEWEDITDSFEIESYAAKSENGA